MQNRFHDTTDEIEANGQGSHEFTLPVDAFYTHFTGGCKTQNHETAQRQLPHFTRFTRCSEEGYVCVRADARTPDPPTREYYVKCVKSGGGNSSVPRLAVYTPPVNRCKIRGAERKLAPLGEVAT